MKDWIQEHYDDQDNKLFYNTLRKAVREAEDAVPSYKLDELINSMKERCQTDAQGKHTHF